VSAQLQAFWQQQGRNPQPQRVHEAGGVDDIQRVGLRTDFMTRASATTSPSTSRRLLGGRGGHPAWDLDRIDQLEPLIEAKDHRWRERSTPETTIILPGVCLQPSQWM